MNGPFAFDRQLMEQLGELARLRLTSDREPLLRERLTRILAAFRVLQELPLSSTGAETPTPPPLREDGAEPPLPIDQVLANAPQHAASAFIVPRVVDA